MLCGFLILAFLIFTLVIFLTEKVLNFINYLLSFQDDYYIVDNNGNPLYRIIKISSNNNLLVESNGIEEFIDAMEHRRYKRVRRESKLREDFYNSSKIIYLIVVVWIISIVSLITLFLSPLWLQFFLYLISLLTFMIGLLLTLNYSANKKPEINNNMVIYLLCN